MKKLSLVVVLSLFVSVITFGAGWIDDGNVVSLTTPSDKVCIGAVNPNKKLNVNGHIWIPISKRIYFGGASILGYQDGYPGLKLYGNGGGYDNLGITVTSSGRIGIMKSSASYPLDVNGTIQMTGFKLTSGDPEDGDFLTYNGSTGKGEWSSISPGGGSSYWEENDGGNIYCAGEYDKVGIMTTTPNSYLSVGGDGNSNYAIYGYNATGVCGQSVPAGSYYSATGVLGIGEDFGVKAEAYTGSGMGIGVRSGGHAYDFYAESSSGKSYFAGKVGIGTQNPQTKLAVNGTITAEEIKVQLDILPDFVFEDNYKLIPLNRLEKVIKKEKSLPGIPTSKEAVENGVKLGDMQSKLLQKVEELTLYLIEQDKEIAELKERIAELER